MGLDQSGARPLGGGESRLELAALLEHAGAGQLDLAAQAGVIEVIGDGVDKM